jgi:UDP-glucose 4-epimerase
MNILVTGGAGFIGVNLIKSLLTKNYNITSLDNYSTGLKKNEIDGVKYINSDIELIDQLGPEFDLCFHLAAQSRVQPSFEDPQESIRVNVNGTMKVMEWAKKHTVKVIYAGSSSKHHDPSDSPYAMTKFLGEEICKLYKKAFKVNVEIARFYNVYGPHEPLDEKFGNVIGIWREKVRLNKPLTIVGDGNQKRD